jgi:hypothetical protein
MGGGEGEGCGGLFEEAAACGLGVGHKVSTLPGGAGLQGC